MRRDTFPFLLTIAGAAIILLVTLLLPLGFDNDVYESMAWTLYAYHGLPYLTSWDMNFPGIVFIHWASIALFDASDFGFRLFDYMAHILMAAIYYRLLRTWLSRTESMIAVVLYSLYYTSGAWGLAGQRDTYAAMLLLIAVLLFLRERTKPAMIQPFLLGLCCGGAILIRPTYIFFPIAFGILLWNIPERTRTIALLLLGCAIPFTLFLLPYLFIPGGLAQIYDSIIRFNLEVYSSVSVPVNLWSRGRAPIYFFAMIGLVFALRSEHPNWDRRDAILFLLLAACALISPIIMGKYFTYHFEPFLLLAIGFAAMGLSRVVALLRIPSLQYAVIAVALLLFAFAYYPRHLIRYYFENLKTGQPLEATYERVLSDSVFGLAAQKEVKSYVNRHLRPNDRVEYVSLFPDLRWRIQRPEATRFTTILPIVARREPGQQHRGRCLPAYNAAWKREFLDSLSRVRPSLVITSRSEAWWPFANMTADSALRSIPGFDSLLTANYLPDTVIHGFTIYRIRQ